MAKLSDKEYLCDTWDFDADREDNIKAEDEWFRDLKQQLRQAYPGEYVGEVLKWQRADGYAVYVVVNESPLEIAWVDYGDGYRVEPALIRGLIMEDVEEMVAQDRRWLELIEANRSKKKEVLRKAYGG